VKDKRFSGRQGNATLQRRREYGGTWTILADNFEDKKLNAPNDAAIHADGSIWFTDPGYGILGPYEGHKAEFELPTRVYRRNGKTGKLSVISEGKIRRPNGLASRRTSRNFMWSIPARPTVRTPPTSPYSTSTVPEPA
jgi:sugar lactone lactonase YvrE